MFIYTAPPMYLTPGKIIFKKPFYLKFDSGEIRASPFPYTKDIPMML